MLREEGELWGHWLGRHPHSPLENALLRMKPLDREQRTKRQREQLSLKSVLLPWSNRV